MLQNQIQVGQEVIAVTSNGSNRKYKLIKQVGQGGQGKVFLAQTDWFGNNNENREVALKFAPKYQTSSQEMDFLRNIMSYQSSENELNYQSNIIKIFDCFEYNDYFVTVMEKGDIDLFYYIKQIDQRKENLTEKEKLKICLEVTQSIHFLHSNSILHRDIKPENYLKVGQIQNDRFWMYSIIQNLANNDNWSRYSYVQCS